MMMDHAGLCPADVEASLRFYRDGIGLTVLADFTIDADLEPLLGRATEHVRAVFLGSPDSPNAGTLELLDFGDGEIAGQAADPGLPRRGLFLVSFVVDVDAVLSRLDELGLGGRPRRGHPDGVTVELLSRPVLGR